MTLRLYNTLTRRKEELVPLDPQNVRMYVCGPTVYDFAHIGNARPVIVFDVLYRLLRHVYGPDHVTYARNITDVDDKIIDRARRDFPDLALNEAIGRVTSQTEKQFHDDVAALGCLPPTIEPHATAHIPQMIAMIQRLIDNGKAYVASGGAEGGARQGGKGAHVLFAVGAFEDYGRLARRSTDEMVAGARVEVAPYKKDPMDFVLWKPSAADEPGWDSPWGRGRPGWHIECSAMSDHWLWEKAKSSLSEGGLEHPHTFDIHGGGIDLVFPHHENEVAQSRGAHGTDRMASIWMHNGYLQVEGRKMSKSEGNFVTIRDLLASDRFAGRKWPGRTLRVAMLSTHYRQPIDFSASGLASAHERLAKWTGRSAGPLLESDYLQPSTPLIEALSDDLNTPEAFTELDRLAAAARSNHDKKQLSRALRFLGLLQSVEEMKAALDVVNDNAEYMFSKYEHEHINTREEIEAFYEIWNKINVNKAIDARNAARAEKNFAEADRIRDELAEMGIQLKDGPDGTTWEVAR